MQILLIRCHGEAPLLTNWCVNPNCRSRKVLRDSQALKAVHEPPDKDVCLKHASS